MFGTTNATPNLRPTWNMAPSMDAPVVRLHPETRARHLDPLRWGLVPSFATDLKSARKPINARSETAATAPVFKAAFARRRCLVPAEAFYEWRTAEDGKAPYAIARVDGQPLVLAGLWEGWRGPDGGVLRSFAILTTAANRTMHALHHRMPVILEPGDWPLWLGEQDGDPATLLRPADDAVVRFWPVDRAVGNVRNDGPHLLAPLAVPDPADGFDPPGPSPA